MKQLNVCFVGIGSIAKRHIRNLTLLCELNGIDLSIDAVRRSGKNSEDLNFRKVYRDESELEDFYDAVFITNPTEFHVSTLLKVMDKTRGFFIEKPLTSLAQLDAAHEVNIPEGKVCYVACPLRYNPVIEYIKNNINPDDVVSVRSISSSYLPDWRPGTDYRDTYSAHKELGGGVSIDLIHEWDYLTFLFGLPNFVEKIIGKKSDLEIDSDDYAIYVAEYDNKIAELHLDYFGKNTIREIMLITKNGTIIGDIANNKISFLNDGSVIQFDNNRDSYQTKELEHFLSILNGDIVSDSNYIHGLKILKLTQGDI